MEGWRCLRNMRVKVAKVLQGTVAFGTKSAIGPRELLASLGILAKAGMLLALLMEELMLGIPGKKRCLRRSRVGDLRVMLLLLVVDNVGIGRRGRNARGR